VLLFESNTGRPALNLATAAGLDTRCATTLCAELPQKITFIANCVSRGAPADDTLPKLNGSFRFVAGPPNRTRLNALNISNRNSRSIISYIGVHFIMPIFSLKLRKFRRLRTAGALPNVKGAGVRKAAAFR